MQTVCPGIPFTALLADTPRQLRSNEGPALCANLAHHLDDRPILLRTGQRLIDSFALPGNACCCHGPTFSTHGLATTALSGHVLTSAYYSVWRGRQVRTRSLLSVLMRRELSACRLMKVSGAEEPEAGAARAWARQAHRQGPWPLDQVRVEDLLPAVQALHVRPLAVEALGDGLPVLAAMVSDRSPQDLILSMVERKVRLANRRTAKRTLISISADVRSDARRTGGRRHDSDMPRWPELHGQWVAGVRWAMRDTNERRLLAQ